MRIGIKQLAVAVILFMLVGIYSASWMGLWSTTNSKTPAKYEAGSEAAGQYRPDDIRGSHTFGEVAELYGVDVEVLRKAFEIPSDVDMKVYQLKNLETVYADSPIEIGTGSVRTFVALYQDLPYELTEEALPLGAAMMLLEHDNGLSDEEKVYLEAIVGGPAQAAPTQPDPAQPTTEQSVPAQTTQAQPAQTVPAQQTPVQPAPAQPQQVAPPTPESSGTGQGNGTGTHVEGEEPAINGQSTFAAVLALGITEEQIEAVIGGDMPAKNLSIRDYCRDNGLQFSVVKSQLSELVE